MKNRISQREKVQTSDTLRKHQIYAGLTEHEQIFNLCIQHEQEERQQSKEEVHYMVHFFFMFPSELASLKQRNQSQKTCRVDKVKRKQ